MAQARSPHERYFPPGVHATFVDDDVVFLDIFRDAYFCLPDAAALLRMSADARTLTCDADLASELEQAGLIVQGSAEPTTAPTVPWRSPDRSALQDSYPQPFWRDLVEISRALADLGLRYRGRSFAAILDRARRGRARTPTLNPGLLAAVDRFHRWSPYAPASTKCLLRSFMLLRLLHRQGFDAEWVFGVRTWPFSAHCWLQCEDVALDEQPDRIRSYTPILVV